MFKHQVIFSLALYISAIPLRKFLEMASGCEEKGVEIQRGQESGGTSTVRS